MTDPKITTFRAPQRAPQDAVDLVARAQAGARAARQRAYLSERGIEPKGKQQLALLFPDLIGARDDLRHMPNDYGRSSLFTAKNKREPRETLTHIELFHFNEHVKILYTGQELRAEDDEIVWLQILSYGSVVPLGDPFMFNIRDIVRDLGWQKNGRNYDRVRECISRLRATEIQVLNTKAYGETPVMSLIGHYTPINDANGKPAAYEVWLDVGLALLFAGNTFTSHIWDTYRTLTPVARRLADYTKSHREPYPIAIERFRRICGSKEGSITSWRQTVKRACDELVDSGVAEVCFLERGRDQIVILRKA
jgi:hypothetical protein